MNKSKIIVLIVLLILTITGGSLWVLRQYFPPARGVTKDVEFLKRSLRLSESQTDELKKLEENFCQVKGDLCVELCAKRFELSQQFLQAKIDSEKLTEDIGAICSLQGELERKTLQHLVEMDKVLTPAQKEKFFTMLADELCRNCKEGKCAAGDRCALRYSKEGGDNVHSH